MRGAEGAVRESPGITARGDNTRRAGRRTIREHMSLTAGAGTDSATGRAGH